MVGVKMSHAIAALALLSSAPLVAAPAPPAGGTIAIQPHTGDGEYDRAMPAFVDAVGAALEARGFTILDDPNHAASVLDLTLAHADVGTGLTRDPHPAKPMIGPGVIVPLSTGDSHLATLRRTSLELRIRRRADAVVWDGTAVTVREAGTPAGTDKAVATALCEALLRRYPAVPGSVIGVP